MGSLNQMYQSSNANRKMVLREKMKCIRMAKGDSVTFYLTQIKQVRDELAAVGDQIPETELVRTVLFGVANTWATFVQAIVGRENMPSWDRLWDDFIHKEIKRGFVHGGSSMVSEAEENVALQLRARRVSQRKDPQEEVRHMVKKKVNERT